MMILGWPLAYLRQGKICVPIHLYVENGEKSFSENILKTNGSKNTMYAESSRFLVAIKILSLWGYLPLPQGCIKSCNLYNCFYLKPLDQLYWTFYRWGIENYSNGSAPMNEMTAVSVYDKKNILTQALVQSQESFQAESWCNIGDSRSTTFAEMIILGWPLTFLRHSQVYIIVAVVILEDYCVAFSHLQWLLW